MVLLAGRPHALLFLPVPSRSLAVPAGTSARPRLACPGRRRGAPIYEIPMRCHRQELSCLKPFVNTSLHAGEVDVVLTMAEYSPL